MSTNSWLGFLLKLIESGGDGARILRQLREQLELPNWSYLPGHRHQQGWPGWWLGKFGGKFGRRVCQLHASDQQCQFPRGLQVMSTSYHQAWYCEENKGEENKAKFIRKIKKTISTKGGRLIYPWWNDPVWMTPLYRPIMNKAVAIFPGNHFKMSPNRLSFQAAAQSYQTNLISTCFEEWLLKVELIIVGHGLPELLQLLV